MITERKIGSFNKHLRSAKEKFQATSVAYANNHMTVVGDLGTKVAEAVISNLEVIIKFFGKRFGIKIDEKNI